VNDTPERMAAYSGLAAARPNAAPWHFVTTRSQAELQPILDAYGQAVDKKQNPKDPTGPLNHTLRVFLVDAAGNIGNIYSSGTLDPRLVLGDVRTLMMESAKAGANPPPLNQDRSEAAPTKDGDATGTYSLVSVNGNKVPASVSHDGAALEVRSGSFTLQADGTCSTKTVLVPPSGREVTREASAAYTKKGSKLTMRWNAAGRTTGTIKGNTFTMNNEGMVFVYRK
jgi:hypothetical protein